MLTFAMQTLQLHQSVKDSRQHGTELALSFGWYEQAVRIQASSLPHPVRFLALQCHLMQHFVHFGNLQGPHSETGHQPHHFPVDEVSIHFAQGRCLAFFFLGFYMSPPLFPIVFSFPLDSCSSPLCDPLSLFPGVI